MHKGSVAVVGCGWLGFALSQNLSSAGYRVYGTTTSAGKLPELRAAGIAATVLKLPLGDFRRDLIDPLHSREDALWSADQLVLNVPPGRGPNALREYPGAILSAVLAYRRSMPSGRIIYCSSTGVYGDLTGEVDEDTPLRSADPRAMMLALAESQIQSQSQRPNVVLRLAGLYGDERHPGRYLAGRTGLPDGDAPTNLVHRDQVIATIRRYLDAPFWMRAVENVVEDDHRSRRERYTAFAKTEGLPVPTFLDGGGEGKVVVTRARRAAG